MKPQLLLLFLSVSITVAVAQTVSAPMRLQQSRGAVLVQAVGKAKLRSLQAVPLRQAMTTGQVPQAYRRANQTWYFQTLRANRAATGSPNAGVLKTESNSKGTATLGLGMTGDEQSTRLGSSEDESTSGFVCSRSTYKLDLTTVGQFTIFKNATQRKIYPGAFFNPGSILNESFEGVNTPARAPITLKIQLSDPKNTAPRLLTDPANLNKATSLVDSMVRQNYGSNLPAMISGGTFEVASKTQLAAELGLSGAISLPLQELGLPFNADGSMTNSINSRTGLQFKTYVIQFLQPMFTVTVGEPAEKLFTDPNAYKNTDAVMINAVTYGRLGFITVTTVATEAALNAEITRQLGVEAVVDGVTVSGSADVTARADFLNTNSVSSVNVTLFGGSAAQGVQTFNSISGFKNYLTDQGAGRLGPTTGAIPIMFDMVSVRNNNAALGVKTVTDFTVVEDCIPVKELTVRLKTLRVTKAVDNPLDPAEDLWGDISVDFSNTGYGNQVKDLWFVNVTRPLKLRQGESFANFPNGAQNLKIRGDKLQDFKVVLSCSIKDWLDNGERLWPENAGKQNLSYTLMSQSSYGLNEIGSPPLTGPGQSKTVTLKAKEKDAELEFDVEFQWK